MWEIILRQWCFVVYPWTSHSRGHRIERFRELRPPVPSWHNFSSRELWPREIRLKISTFYYLFRAFLQTNFLQANTWLIQINNSPIRTVGSWLGQTACFPFNGLLIKTPRHIHQSEITVSKLSQSVTCHERLTWNLINPTPKPYKYCFLKSPFWDTTKTLKVPLLQQV